MPDFLNNMDPTLLAIIAAVAVLLWPQLKGIFKNLNIPGFSSRIDEILDRSPNSIRLQNWEDFCESCKDVQNKEFQDVLKTLPGFFIETDLTDGTDTKS